MADDYDAHVDAWRWHLRGWRPDLRWDGQFHERQVAPVSGDTLAALRASLMTPMKLTRPQWVKLWIGRHVPTVVVSKARPKRRGPPLRRTVLDDVADQALAALAAEWKRCGLPNLRRGKKAARAVHALLPALIRDVLDTSPSMTAAAIHRLIDERAAVGKYTGPVPDESTVRSIVRGLRITPK